MRGPRLLDPYVPNILLRHLVEAPEATTRTLDATLLFADISGFTRLSERLSRRGREGAEELTDALGGAFGSLLAVAYANNGSLLKFGGDALLLLFDGEGHVERACRSAFGMRRTLRDAGPLATSAGRVTLRMSQGMHSGELHLFLVGGSHRELLVAGPAATAVTQMEKVAGAGEVVVSPATAARLPRDWLGSARGTGRLLTSAPKGREPGPQTLLELPPVDAVAQCLSTEVRAHVASGQQPPEHRQVTTAFVRFEGTDALIRDAGVAACAAALDELVRDVQAAADDRQVCFLQTDVDADGGKITLTAGAPRMVGDDEERMLLALTRIVDRDRALGVRVGVNRGSVFCGDIGAPYRRCYTVMGDAVNVAARLMAHAPPGAVYATAGVLERSATHFATDAVEPFAVKGKRAPLAAWSLGAPLGSRSRHGVPVRFPFVGRIPELQALEGALRAVRAGTGRLVELAGEPGVGKSRLMEELRGPAADLTRLRMICEADTSSTPYIAWREVLRPLIGAAWEAPDTEVLERLETQVRDLRPELLPWLPLLAIPFGADVAPTRAVAELAPAFRNARLHQVVLAYLRARLRGPTLLEIEDAHHMDVASADLLAALVDALPGMPWLVVSARRDGAAGFTAAPGPATLRIDVPELPAADAMALAAAVTDAAPVPPHALQMAVDRSGGNPQFLRDLLRAVATGDAELPDSIETAATARVDRLPAAERTIVRRAAVLGLIFHPRHLPRVLDDGTPPPDAAMWDRLSDIFMEAGDGYLRFRRAVVRDAAYAGLPFGLRRRLHATLGAWLEAERTPGMDELAPVLSLHFARAGEHAKAWRYARRAGDHAMERLAFADAAALYRRALDAGQALDPAADDVAATWEALAEALAHTGELGEAHEALRSARRLRSGDPQRTAELLLRHARLAERAGHVLSAVRWAQRALRTLEDQHGHAATVCRAETLSVLATVRQRGGQWAQAIQLCRRVIAEAEPHADTDPALAAPLAHAWFILDWALYDAGRTEQATHSERALELYRRLGDADREAAVLNNMGGFAYHEGRWGDAVELYEQAAAASARAGDVANAAFGACNVGEVLADQGRLEEAEAKLREAQRVWRGSGYDWGAAFAAMMLGRIAARAGRHDEALVRLDDAQATFRRLRALADASLVEAYRAEALAFAFRPERALRIADRALREAGRSAPLLHRVRGFALAQLGDEAGAAHAFEAALREAEALGSSYELAVSLDALAALSDGDHATAGDLRRRHALFAGLGVVAPPPAPVSPASPGRRRAAAPG